jgi:phage shock protein PspC (stress-responsive transcriptional regulator)
MKKTFTINLNGIVFNIDEDAYEKLHAYLAAIEKHFAKEEERKEIIMDIEARLAEIFGGRINASKQVITIDDVNDVIQIMGQPGDFTEDDQTQGTDESVTNHKKYRRMYRDPDNRLIGGVCSGLSAYFGMDPVFLRLIFLIAFFGFGVGLLIYLILWIVLPEARTTAQKLEMRGEKVNVSSIGNFVKDEFDNVKRSMNFGKRNA